MRLAAFWLITILSATFNAVAVIGLVLIRFGVQ